MRRQLAALFVFGVMAAVSLGAQTAPAGWKQRIDASTDASDPDPAGEVKFTVLRAGTARRTNRPPAPARPRTERRCVGPWPQRVRRQE